MVGVRLDFYVAFLIVILGFGLCGLRRCVWCCAPMLCVLTLLVRCVGLIGGVLRCVVSVVWCWVTCCSVFVIFGFPLGVYSRLYFG